jgi:hypothetical protein
MLLESTISLVETLLCHASREGIFVKWKQKQTNRTTSPMSFPHSNGLNAVPQPDIRTAL